MLEKKQPWGKWFWGDWRKDARLRRCCFAARGLWADMLSLMGGECDRVGFLIMEGQALGASDLVGLLGGAIREVTKLLVELGEKRVYSITGDPELDDDLKAVIPPDMPDGVIFSRRMVRDKAKADADRANGGLGGNPRLKPTHNGVVNPQDKAQNPKPESYSNSNKPEERKKGLEGFIVGKEAGKVPMTDETKLALFQKWLATEIGEHGWKIVGEAANPDSPNYDQAVAFCKERAQARGKGWPHKWPKREAAA